MCKKEFKERFCSNLQASSPNIGFLVLFFLLRYMDQLSSPFCTAHVSTNAILHTQAWCVDRHDAFFPFFNQKFNILKRFLEKSTKLKFVDALFLKDTLNFLLTFWNSFLTNWFQGLLVWNCITYIIWTKNHSKNIGLL